MERRDQVLEITKRELGILKEFLKVLKSERDFIISFSLEGLVECHNKKEMLLKKVEFLESERERILGRLEEEEREKVVSELKGMKNEFLPLLEQIRQEMRKNLDLISFSTDHLKGILEGIFENMNKALGYGRKGPDSKKSSVLFSLEA